MSPTTVLPGSLSGPQRPSSVNYSSPGTRTENSLLKIESPALTGAMAPKRPRQPHSPSPAAGEVRSFSALFKGSGRASRGLSLWVLPRHHYFLFEERQRMGQHADCAPHGSCVHDALHPL